jgi:peptidoglycan/xylan/chitin deacetylase (PgdA/CDA1 family)
VKNISFLSKSRSIKNLLYRILSVLRRFGITAHKYEKLLKRYYTVTSDLGCVPTFAITAITLKRHPHFIRELSKKGVEFAIHGFIHTDYGVVTAVEQARHFQKAVDIFDKCQVSFAGFRAPFLRTNGETLNILNTLDFGFDSSQSLYWNVIDPSLYPVASWNEYERLLEFYKAKCAEDFLSLPRCCDSSLEIPVSIPDDEAMLERLGILEGNRISETWKSILERTYERGELFTLQLHPERIPQFEAALSEIVKTAKLYHPPVWITTLKDIARWWQEKKDFAFEIKSDIPGCYWVYASCSPRATVLARHCNVDVPSPLWFSRYQIINERLFLVKSPLRPVIGISPDVSLATTSFLTNNGYIFEVSENSSHYGIYLSNLGHFNEADEKPLMEYIEKSEAPLLRYWRWPDQARSALSITGDIDAMTLIDFALRIKENFVQNHKA